MRQKAMASVVVEYSLVLKIDFNEDISQTPDLHPIGLYFYVAELALDCRLRN